MWFQEGSAGIVARSQPDGYLSCDSSSLGLPRLRRKLGIERRVGDVIQIVAQRLERYDGEHIQNLPLAMASGHKVLKIIVWHPTAKMQNRYNQRSERIELSI